MGEVVKIRDYQTQEQIARARKALEEHIKLEAIQIANEAIPCVFDYPAVPVDYDPRKQWPSNYRVDD